MSCPCAKGKAPPGPGPCLSKPGGGCGGGGKTLPPAAAPLQKKKPCGPKPCGGGKCKKCGKGGPGGNGGKGGSGNASGGIFGGLSAPPNNRGPMALGLAALLFAAGVYITTRLGLVASEIG